MILPTVGRVVWFHPHVDTGRDPNGQPLAAIVAKVIDDRIVNLGVFNADGTMSAAQHVTLLQDGDELADPEAAYAEWMPFQKGQAAKHDSQAASPVQSLEPVHAKIHELEATVHGKFAELGTWLKTTFEDIEERLNRPATPPAPDKTT